MNKIIGSILLVAGTTIGAGMVALPIVVGVAGFFYGSIVIFGCFLYMLLSMLLLLEASLYCPKKSNIITMHDCFFSPKTRFLAWSFVLLLMYSVSAAYIDAGSDLLVDMINRVLPHQLHWSRSIGLGVFTLCFTAATVTNISIIDRINRLFVAVMATAFIGQLIAIIQPWDPSHFIGGNARYALTAIPVIILSFTSTIILPSLREYLEDNIKTIRFVIIVGNIIPLAIYLVWIILLINAIPIEGEASLTSIALSGSSTALPHVLRAHHLDHASTWIDLFSLTAVITSFTGVIVSLRDFLADGLQLDTSSRDQILTSALSMLPPLLSVLAFPKLFIIALGWGGLSIVLLYVLMPLMMVYRARYVQQLPCPDYRLPGGKMTLAILFFYTLAAITIQLAATLHLLPQL